MARGCLCIHEVGNGRMQIAISRKAYTPALHNAFFGTTSHQIFSMTWQQYHQDYPPWYTRTYHLPGCSPAGLNRTLTFFTPWLSTYTHVRAKGRRCEKRHPDCLSTHHTINFPQSLREQVFPNSLGPRKAVFRNATPTRDYSYWSSAMTLTIEMTSCQYCDEDGQ